ncbi:MAG TPA: glycosyltransferase family 39 protein [Stellaceae bacterium]|nr:glycosyltransferase family 39 protein [Stellaceae bacterium]
MAAAIFLRFYHISHLSLWNDEAFSAFYYRTGLAFMWTEGLRRESSPPLYYMIIEAWVHLFGDSETALRSLSAVSSILAVGLVYLLARALLGAKPALAAALLFAASATAIYYAQEARPYALLLLPVAATLFACTRFLRSPQAPLALAGYVIAGTVSIYTHATLTFFVAACGIAVLHTLWWVHGPSWQRFALGWIGGNVAVTVLAVPELNGMLHHVESGILSWIPPVSAHALSAVLSNTFAGTLTPGHFPGGILAVLLASVLVVGIWRAPLSSPTATIAVLIPLLYAALVVLVSVVSQPILLSRIFSWVGIPLCLLEAHALTVRGWWRPVMLTVIGGVTAVGLFYQLDASPDAKQPWRQTVAAVEPELMQADLVVLGAETDPAPLMYYAPNLSHVVVWQSRALPSAQVGIMAGLFGIDGVAAGDIIRRIVRGDRVFFVAGPTDSATTSLLLTSAPVPGVHLDRPCIGGDGKPTRFPCGITVLGWRPATAPGRSGAGALLPR